MTEERRDNDDSSQAGSGASNRQGGTLRGVSSPDEVIDRALEVLHERDEWLAANRHAIDATIRRGIEELDRGEGNPEDELDVHLERLKSQTE